MQSIICFISDLGLDDAWVGICHAVIHRACPQARVVDLTHQVRPYDIRKAASVAAAGVYQLPDAIHLVVVDPGVGAGRADLCIITGSGAALVGPDNGVLIPAARRAGGIVQAIAIDPSKIDFRAPLATFHARDVLAPAAAALSCGVVPEALGESIDPDSLVAAPFGECAVQGGQVHAEVLEMDRFGSVRVNVTAEEAKAYGLTEGELDLAIGHNRLGAPFAHTFADVGPGEPVLLIDSSGWLTLALNRESAAERYGIEVGMPVVLQASR